MQFTQFSRGIFQLHVLPKAQAASTDADCEQGMRRNAESQEKSEREHANPALGEFVPTCPYFYQQSFLKPMHCRGGFLAISGQDFPCPLAQDLHLQMWLPPVPAAWTPAPSLHQEASSCYHVTKHPLLLKAPASTPTNRRDSQQPLFSLFSIIFTYRLFKLL